MTDVAITQNVIESLRAAVAGPVLTPDQDGYAAEITGFEMAVEHAPAIAIGATDADDVVATVRTAAAPEFRSPSSASGTPRSRPSPRESC